MKDVRAIRRKKRRLRKILHLMREVLTMTVCFGCLFLVEQRLTAEPDDGAKKEMSVSEQNFNKEAVEETSDKETVVKEWLIAMDGISQDGIPTGCESVSTVTVLRFMGVDVSVDEFINTYLRCENFWKEGGRVFGPNPHECFAGNPYEQGSLGCFSEVIVDAVLKMKSSGYAGMQGISVENVTGCGLGEICNEYVAKDIPVIVWVTMGMVEPYDGTEYYLKDGSRYVWKAKEHCMVLCGFDAQNYYLMDPLSGGEMVCFERDLVEKRYEQMGKEAVVIR